jgi:glycosyltransferase involved in cell wall biosynthesis
LSIKNKKKGHIDVSILIPVYNEEQAIYGVIDGIDNILKKQQWTFEIIAIDDGSNDETYKILEKTNAVIVKHINRRGYGAALKSGLKKANGNCIVMLDGDGTYPLDEIPTILAAMKNADMVIGARIGPQIYETTQRKILKKIIQAILIRYLKTDIQDFNSGCRAFKYKAIMSMFDDLPDGFSFTTTSTVVFIKRGLQIEYVPINYYRRVGKSKFHPIKDTLKVFLLLYRIMVQS